jgi:hypothetical protein
MSDTTERVEVSFLTESGADDVVRSELFHVPSMWVGTDERVRALQEEVDGLRNVVGGLERELAEARACGAHSATSRYGESKT